jgi:glycosyltransferase involved in cell wall biosynthesis
VTRAARILVVTPRYAPADGGVERHVVALARGMNARGVSLQIATTDPTGSLPAEEVLDGIPVHRFDVAGGDDVFFLSPGIAAWLAVHARDYDLVHAHSYHTPVALAAAAAARFAGRPLVLTPHYHGTGHTAARSRLHRPYRVPGGWMVRGADALICCSEAEATLVREHFGDDLPITVIPHGVDAAAFAGAAPLTREDGPTSGRPLVLAGGRLEGYKQVERVVEAMALLPDHDLAIFGSGPAAGSLARLVAASGMADRVRMLGRVTDDDLRRWYRTADAFVTLSREEAFGLTVLEAVAAGTAVIASDIPAYTEQARTLPAPWLRVVSVDAGPDAVGAAIRAAGLRRDRGPAPATRGWEASVAATTDVYRTVLAARGRTLAGTGRGAAA